MPLVRDHPSANVLQSHGLVIRQLSPYTRIPVTSNDMAPWDERERLRRVACRAAKAKLPADHRLSPSEASYFTRGEYVQSGARAYQTGSPEYGWGWVTLPMARTWPLEAVTEVGAIEVYWPDGPIEPRM